MIPPVSFACGDLRVTAYLPDGPLCACGYTVAGAEEMAAVFHQLPGSGMAIFALEGLDWNDLSPWPAPAVFRDPFTGRAESVLHQLRTRVIPACEALLETHGIPVPGERVLFGYSLCGLFALWSAAVCDDFTRIGCFSGSLWFDGFTDWFRAHAGDVHARSVALSLGDKERQARNPRMARVQDAVQECFALLQSLQIPCSLQLYPGGHFRDVPLRIAGGLQTLLQEIRCSGAAAND